MYYYIVWIVCPDNTKGVVTSGTVNCYEDLHGLEFEVPEGSVPRIEHGTLH